MPRYTINTSQFSPFSMEEMLKPFSLYKEQYDKTSDKYDIMSDELGAVNYLVQTLPDNSPVKQTFNQYMNDVAAGRDALAEGLTPEVISDLTKLKRNYKNVISPITEAEKARRKTAEWQQQIRAKDPSAIFEIDANDKDSFAYFVDNPGKLGTNMYSPNTITALSMEQAKNLKNAILHDPTFDKTTPEGILLQQNGLTDEDLQNVLNNPDKYPLLSKILNDSVGQSGLSNFSEKQQADQLGRAIQAAGKGVSAGLSQVTNPDFIDALHQQQLKMERDRIGISRGNLQLSQDQWEMNPNNLKSETLYGDLTSREDKLKRQQEILTGIRDATKFPTGQGRSSTDIRDGNGNIVNVVDHPTQYTQKFTIAGGGRRKHVQTTIGETATQRAGMFDSMTEVSPDEIFDLYGNDDKFGNLAIMNSIYEMTQGATNLYDFFIDSDGSVAVRRNKTPLKQAVIDDRFKKYTGKSTETLREWSNRKEAEKKSASGITVDVQRKNANNQQGKKETDDNEL